MSTSPERQSPTSGSHYQPRLPVVVVILVLFVIAAFTFVHATTSSSTTSSAAPSTSAPHHTATTTTVPPIHVPLSSVSVQVANGSGIHGLARTLTERLQTLGWDTLAPINGPHVGATVIYWKSGYTWAGQQIATVLKVPATSLAPMPASNIVPGALGDDIVVILGPNAGL